MDAATEYPVPAALDTDAEAVWRFAGWVGQLSSDDYLRSFTTLLIALLRATNELSTWFFEYAWLSQCDIDGVFQARQFTATTKAEIERRAADGAKSDGKRSWTTSVDHLFKETVALAQEVGDSEIGVRHLLGAYFIGIRRNQALHSSHAKQMEIWRFDLGRESSALIRRLQRRGFAVDGWISRHSEAFGSAPDLTAADPLPEFRLSGIDNDVAAQKQDFLNIDDDVYALASVICSRKVVPPLSIGLFGDWGSGKTFFMEKLRESVDWISKQSRLSGKLQRDLSFYKRVVQIEFNAWNYSSGNLWASLVQHILENLRINDEEGANLVEQRRLEIQNNMNLKKEAIEIAQQNQQAAQNSLGTAKKELQDLKNTHEARVKELKQVMARDVWSNTVIPKEEIEDLKNIRKEIGLDTLVNSSSELLAVIGQTRALLTRGAASLAPGMAGGSYRFWLGVAAILLIPVAATIVVPSLIDKAQSYTQEIAAAGAWLSTTIGVVTVWLRNQNVRIANSIDKVEKLNGTVQQRVDAEKARQAAEAAEIEKRISLAQTEITAAQGRIDAAQQEFDHAQLALEKTTAASVLSDLIEKRSGSEDYRRYLGLLAVIRKDFKEISDLIEQENTALELMTSLESEDRDAARRINRIVLYIDDLDRCTQDKVIEVLQAVHLLLALPLFTVVVAVDSRWMSRSLAEGFPGLLSGEFGATPHDYLEKIFQIPFWVKSMDDPDVNRMLTGLLKPAAQATQAPDANGKNEQASKQSDAYQPAGRRQYEENPKSLEVDANEMEFVESLAPLLSRSPRALKRFANVYRMIKASLPPDEAREMNFGQTPFGPPCRVILLTLAISTGFPEAATEILAALSEGKPFPQDLPPEIIKWLDKHIPDWRLQSTQDLTKWAKRVSRYTFRPATAGRSKAERSTAASVGKSA